MENLAVCWGLCWKFIHQKTNIHPEKYVDLAVSPKIGLLAMLTMDGLLNRPTGYRPNGP